MARSKRKELVRKGHLPELREWLNAATGLAALLLALVSFWTTARISGLEDYLRSEITRRNSDLDLLSDRSKEVEHTAAERERQLARLDAATNEIVASSLLANAQLAESQASLAQVRSDVMSAQSKLANAEIASEALRGKFAEQSRNFELFQRQQAHQRAFLFLSRMAGMPILKDQIPSGEAMLKLLADIPNPPDAPSLAPYFLTMRKETAMVCPSFASIQVTLPAKPAVVVLPEMPQDSPREDAMKRYRKMLEQYADRRDGYYEKQRAYSEAAIEEQFRLVSEAGKCMCKALATLDFSESDICDSTS